MFVLVGVVVLCMLNGVGAVPCRPDFMYYDGFCYYRFDTTTQLDFRVPLSKSEDACLRLGRSVLRISIPERRRMNGVTWYTWPDHYIATFLRDNFIPWAGSSYRVYESGDDCRCSSPRGWFVECGCEDLNFPLCVYFVMPHGPLVAL